MDLIEEAWEQFCAFFSQKPEHPVQDEIIERLRSLQIRLENSNISEQIDDLEEMHEDLEYLRKVARASEALRIDYVHKFNYAFCGQSGCGKSSLIKALLTVRKRKLTGLVGLFNRFISMFSPEPPYLEGPGIGEIEGTMETTCYFNPKFPNLAFWDLPGAGTREHPATTYYEDKALFAFDALLLIVSERIYESDLEIVRRAKDRKKPVIVLQTKCDSHLKNKIGRERKMTMKQAAEIFRKEKLEDLRQQLSKVGLQENNIDMLMVSSLGFGGQECPYTFGFVDRSLTAMDEKKIFPYLRETAAHRINALV